MEAAQERMYQAREQRSSARRIEPAREAFWVHPGCADAHSLLAVALWERAVAAADTALGKCAFVEGRRAFWGLLETRPYMRARHGLAQCLWNLGERGAASKRFQELLRLNPNDSQGVRYQLAARMLEAGEDDALDVLLVHCTEGATAVWPWSAALAGVQAVGGLGE